MYATAAARPWDTKTLQISDCRFEKNRQYSRSTI
jgi:hypothetical protein